MSTDIRLDLVVRLKMRVKMAAEFESFSTAREWTLKFSDVKLFEMVNRRFVSLHES